MVVVLPTPVGPTTVMISGPAAGTGERQMRIPSPMESTTGPVHGGVVFEILERELPAHPAGDAVDELGRKVVSGEQIPDSGQGRVTGGRRRGGGSGRRGRLQVALERLDLVEDELHRLLAARRLQDLALFRLDILALFLARQVAGDLDALAPEQAQDSTDADAAMRQDTRRGAVLSAHLLERLALAARLDGEVLHLTKPPPM